MDRIAEKEILQDADAFANELHTNDETKPKVDAYKKKTWKSIIGGEKKECPAHGIIIDFRCLTKDISITIIPRII